MAIKINIQNKMEIKKSKKEIIKEFLRTKEDLDDLEKYMEDFTTFLPLAICALNLQGIIIDINRTFEKLTGFKSLEIIGQSFEELFLEKERVQEMIKGKVKEKELTLLTKNKNRIPVSVSFGFRKDREGIRIGFFVSLTNISKLKEYQKGLEEKVKERTKELQERIDELEKFHKLAVGRELKMVELKEEIRKLQEELKKIKVEKQFNNK